ncbi:SMP-30/gluconolactonase/LRE family protein [Microlunatus flavus]|uniref:Gluconolactonase n=1 Tax=Microlunatus flavus TaxID=1036181 RepID=A0A1H9HNY8_9ACTN|nr:SMP-30/gluconolactonase/LRE family protein [Microlunatus flavus]SEQ63976.1 gluconolactonase [Microlunatus flavus]
MTTTRPGQAPADSLPTRWERYDERFAKVDGDWRVERIASGCRWTEGGTYLPASRSFVWSDIPNDRQLRWDELTGEVGVLRSPAGYPNGSTLDHQGRLVTCEHGGRRVRRVEHDGSVSVVVDRFEGRRFNSPNDVVVDRRGRVWFTDPSYGIATDYEGFAAEEEVGGHHVYRVDLDGSCHRVTDDFAQPNGIAFSLDERQLYVVDSERRHLRVFDVTDDGTLTGGDVLAASTAGTFDGVRLDTAGRIWAAAEDGVHCLHPDGTLLGKLLLPEVVANITFGGLKRNLLFACASTSVYLLMLNVTGAPGPYAQAVGS